MALNEEIKKLRQRAGLPQRLFAKKLDISPVHVSQIERDPSRGGTIPSPKLLKKMADVFSASEQEKVETERLLLLELTKAKAPEELATFFENSEEKEEKLFYGNSMPSAFIQRIKKDIEGFQGDSDTFFAKTGISDKELSALKNGNLCINRKQVKMLAASLNQPVDEYLILSEYIPDRIMKLLHNKAGLSFIDFLSKLSPAATEDMLKLFLGVVEFGMKITFDKEKK